jgi:alkanesulfonate monooxygenase SsuD/methylene tetrahydromethanopterin reductase-like flavin-dependent oxidoreductase (luciferase family)
MAADVSARRPFRFGVQSFSAGSAAEWRDKARRTEDLGYSVLSLADHFIGPGPAQEATSHPPQELAAVPAIAVAAEATTRLRVGCRVFCVDYRHPVMLAKEAATLDLLSEGRVEIGLGAGWLAGEYAASPRRRPRSTCSPKAASRSASVRAGSPASTRQPTSPSSPPACASRSWRRPSLCSRC